MTLKEFLLARISEDEAEFEGVEGAWAVRLDPAIARLKAECAVKRGIISEPFTNDRGDMDQWECVLEWLALPYADHPDYRREWKP